jgi:cupin 2 domain-containing protein
VKAGNLFDGAEERDRAGNELSTDLLALPASAIRVERVVSHGQYTPPDHWFDQDQTEWVLLVSGRARLEFDGPEEALDLAPGHWVEIPPHRRHRVAWTDPNQPTIWLAVWVAAKG